jgi:PEGA domain-containing protein
MPLLSDEKGEEEPEMPTSSKRTLLRRRAWIAAGLVLTASAGVLFAGQRFFSSPAPSVGTLSVDTNPQGAVIFIDGQQRGQTPAQLSLTPGPHTLVLQGDGETRTLPVTIAAGTTASQYIELPKVKEPTGQVQVSTEPSGARVSVDGQPRGTTPLIISDLTPGEHVVTLESDLGSVNHAVKIEPGLSASLIVPLAPRSGAPGWMSLSTPVEMQLYEQGRLLGSSEIERLMLPAGKHEIEIVNEALGYRATRSVQVSPGKTSTLSVDLPKGVVSLNATPWASVWIDGQNVGDTPIGNLSVPIGPHEVMFRHPQLGERRRVINVTLRSPARLSIDLTTK